MAFLEFKNVRISGISAGVPKHIEYNKDYPYLFVETKFYLKQRAKAQ